MYRLMHLFQITPPEVMNRSLIEISLQCIVLSDNCLTSSTDGVQPVNKTLLECRDIFIHGVSLIPHGLQSRGIGKEKNSRWDGS